MRKLKGLSHVNQFKGQHRPIQIFFIGQLWFKRTAMTLIVTGGAGFIGSNFVLDCLKTSDEPVVNLDKLTYAIDARKIERELGWRPAETFESGIRKTVAWYLANQDWGRNVQSGAYRAWVDKNYASRETAK